MFTRIKLFVGLAAIAALFLGVSGCTDPVGSRFRQDAASLEGGNTSPHRAGWVDETGSMDATSPGPITNFVARKDGIVGQTTGVTTGLFAPVGNVPVGLISGKDTSIKAKKVETGGFVVSDLEIITSASDPTVAQGVLYNILAPVWIKQSEDQREQTVQTVAATLNVAAEVARAGLEAAAKAFVPVP